MRTQGGPIRRVSQRCNVSTDTPISVAIWARESQPSRRAGMPVGIASCSCPSMNHFRSISSVRDGQYEHREGSPVEAQTGGNGREELKYIYSQVFAIGPSVFCWARRLKQAKRIRHQSENIIRT